MAASTFHTGSSSSDTTTAAGGGSGGGGSSVQGDSSGAGSTPQRQQQGWQQLVMAEFAAGVTYGSFNDGAADAGSSYHMTKQTKRVTVKAENISAAGVVSVRQIHKKGGT